MNVILSINVESTDSWQFIGKVKFMAQLEEIESGGRSD